MGIRVFTLMLLGGVSLYTLPALAGKNIYPNASSSKPPLQTRVEAGVRAGTDRSLATTEIWVPIAQNMVDGSVVYGDLRLMGDDQENQEFNLGIGYREMVNNALNGEGIVGAHLWFDKRLTDGGSSFNQVTLGTEWFSDDWDAKFNAYIPLNKHGERTLGVNPNGVGTSGFAGNQFVINSDLFLEEQALMGFDVELGHRISFLDDVTDSTRVYGGFYNFTGQETKDVRGWRARVSSDITQDIQLGARVQHDAVRGSQGFLEATIRFPFGNKQSYKEQGLYARLDESPERDVDIVSNNAIADDGVNELVNTESGTIQNIIHVDNTATAGGDGTNEKRFNTLAQAQAAAGAHDIIYVHHGDGTTTGQDQGITLSQEGQMLIGSGTDLTFDQAKFRFADIDVAGDTVLIAQSAAPVITNTAGNGVGVTGANTYLAGFTVNGATGNGINVLADNGANLGSIIIEDVTSNNNAQTGVSIRSNSIGTSIEQVVIKNTTTSFNTVRGMLVHATSGGNISEASIMNVVANSNATDRGIVVQASNAGSVIGQSIVQNTTTNNNVQNGLNIVSQQGGRIISSNIDNATSNNNTSNGVVITVTSNSILDQSSIISTTTSMNVSGISIQVLSNGNLVNSSINGAVANNNTSRGIVIQPNGSGSIIGQSDITNTTTNGNAIGLLVQATSDSDITNSSITGSISNNNTDRGIIVDANGVGTTIAQSTITNTVTNANATQGTLVRAMGGGILTSSSISGATANTNTQNGIVIQSINAGSTIAQSSITGSTANTNAAAGIYVNGLSGGALNTSVFDSTTTGNATNGVYVDDDTTGSFVTDLGGGTLSSTGGNSIFGNTGTDIRVDVDGGQLKAESNWWGVGTGLAGGETTLEVGSTIDSTPFLAAAP